MIITAYQKRTVVKSLTLNDADGTAITLGAGDIIRVKIGRDRAVPVLDLSSSAATANGSSVSAENPSTLILNQDDLNAITPGVYDLEVAMIDASQSSVIKTAEEGLFVLYPSQLGGVT